MRSVLPTGRGRRHFRRWLAAIVLPALAAVVGPSAASAATRHVWVCAAPAKWNAVPNGRDVLHGTRFGPRATTFPTVVYRRYPRNWRRPLRLPYGVGANAGSPSCRPCKVRTSWPRAVESVVAMHG